MVTVSATGKQLAVVISPRRNLDRKTATMPKKKTLEPATMKHSATTLRNARLGTNVSQRELSKRIGVTQPLVSSWEHGKSIPSLHQLVAIEQSLLLAQGELILGIAYSDSLESPTPPEQ